MSGEGTGEQPLWALRCSHVLTPHELVATVAPAAHGMVPAWRLTPEVSDARWHGPARSPLPRWWSVVRSHSSWPSWARPLASGTRGGSEVRRDLWTSIRGRPECGADRGAPDRLLRNDGRRRSPPHDDEGRRVPVPAALDAARPVLPEHVDLNPDTRARAAPPCVHDQSRIRRPRKPSVVSRAGRVRAYDGMSQNLANRSSTSVQPPSLP